MEKEKGRCRGAKKEWSHPYRHHHSLYEPKPSCAYVEGSIVQLSQLGRSQIQTRGIITGRGRLAHGREREQGMITKSNTPHPQP